MTNVQWKMLAPYSALPVLLLAMVLVHWDRLSGTELLMRLVFTAFGYQAALGDLREKREQTLYLVFSGVTGFLLAGVVFLAVYLISRRGLGGGDVKLMAVAGLYLGFGGVLPAMLYGSVLSALTALVLIARKKIKPRDSIPLVPFLYVGMMLTMFIR